MHNTSTLYNQIWNGTHTVKTVAEIQTVQNNETVYVELDDTQLYSVKTTGSLFSESNPSIGNFVSRELDMTFIPPDAEIPRMARIRLFVYITDGSRNSERIPKGTFYIDTRKYNDDKSKMMVHCYDAALKFDADFDGSLLAWPAKAEDLVQAVSLSAGVPLEANVQNFIKQFSYRSVPLIPNISKRELLASLACMFGANFAINDNGELQIYPLNTEVDEVDFYYLVDENSNRITMGGDYIIV